ncbi:MAG: multicopper oxidase family protein [Microbacterium sp.]
MSAILLGFGYLLLAAAGAACWAFALAGTAGAGTARAGGGGEPRSRSTSLLVGAALALLVVRGSLVWTLAESDPGFAQEKVTIGLPLSVLTSALAAVAWWMPRRATSAGRAGLTAGAFAAAAAAAVVEIVLTVAVGAPAGLLAALAAVAVVVGAGLVAGLTRSGPTRRARRPAFAAASAAVAVIVAVGAVAVVGALGDGALQRAGFGPAAAHAHGSDDGAGADGAGVDVTELVESRHSVSGTGETIDVELRAQRQSIELPSGRSIDAWTFGALAGPAIVAHVGDTLSMHLSNADIEAGATVHWHGYPVANAFDGVAGVTQDAVRPGGDFDAEIAMTQAGTYWYHTHQRGSQGVVRGLYGTLVVLPASGQTEDVDLTLPVHTFSGSTVLGASDVLEERVVEPGQSVRLRFINTDQTPRTFLVQGVPFRVVALDGMDVASEVLDERSVVLAAGGRADVVLEMPDATVRVGVGGDRAGGLGLVPRAREDIPALLAAGAAFDPLADLVAVGEPQGAPRSDAAEAIDDALDGEGFDVERTLLLDRLPRLVQGMPSYAYTVDGRVYPYIDPTIVDEGDTVRLRLVNRSFETHPMHPHGHAVRVLSVDGRIPEQPLWLDTFDVGPGQVWEVALYADNPGIWMDHCHNLEHAALGMVTHLAYRGVTTSFDHGGVAQNAPE